MNMLNLLHRNNLTYTLVFIKNICTAIGGFLIAIYKKLKLPQHLDIIMKSNEFNKIKCPVCGNEMLPGYITGKGSGLRWCIKEKTKTIFSGTKLRKKIDWWNAPNLEAVRCENCEIGVFRYNY